MPWTVTSPIPAPQNTIHRKGKSDVVCPVIAAYRSLAEDYPQQPQPIGDRDARTYTWHHGECRYGLFLVLIWRYSSFVGSIADKSGEAPSKKGIAGVLEVDTCTQHPHLYHLSSELQPWKPLLSRQDDREILHRHERVFANTLIILMKWWIEV